MRMWRFTPKIANIARTGGGFLASDAFADRERLTNEVADSIISLRVRRKHHRFDFGDFKQATLCHHAVFGLHVHHLADELRAVWPDLWPLPTDTPDDPADLYNGVGLIGSSGPMMRACIARHDSRQPGSAPTAAPLNKPLPGLVNISLADGHVESALLDALTSE